MQVKAQRTGRLEGKVQSNLPTGALYDCAPLENTACIGPRANLDLLDGFAFIFADQYTSHCSPISMIIANRNLQ